ETMLADMAVAVHPEDERYKSVIGKDILQPITGRRFKVVGDEHADPELGSGAVKITPGHDFNDFEVGKRAGFRPADMLNMFDAEAKVVQTADGLIPEKYVGMDRFDARDAVVAEMKALDCLIPHVTRDKEGNEVEHDAEPRTIQTPYGDRGGVVIEPWLTDQWYVDAEKLAQAPIEAVRSGAIEIVPKTWEKTFFNWMENIQPWCVSRQLWWGHRIPAWYGPDGEVFVAETEDEVTRLAVAHYQKQGLENPQIDLLNVSYAKVGNEVVGWVGEVRDTGQHPITSSTVTLTRDEDVLDTWFSSALWPFATLGWPEEEGPTPDPSRKREGSETCQAGGEASRSGVGTSSLLAKHYPNDLLISGFDILFFWDARMAMQGIHFMKEVPWKRLYLHGLVRAADGAKMSKSKGNVVDPLGLIEQYGADALRFFMAAMESQGRDIKMDDKRVEGYRNFATKLWNAARFCQSNGIGASTSIAAPAATSAVNKWIIGEVTETLAELDKAMADLRFDAAANTIYHFVWDQFCDWYIELIKPVLSADEGGNFDDETRAVAGWVLDQILVMLHPFMPFVTEELWSKLGERTHYPIITAKWPEPGAGVDAEAKAEVEWLIALVGNLRAAKSELGISPGARLTAYLPDPSDATRAFIENNRGVVDRLARLDAIRFEATPAGAAMQLVAGDATLAVPLEGVIDIDAEKARLEKAKAAAEKERDSLAKRLGNPNFVEKAKPEAVDKARADHAHHTAEAERLAAALERLG
ncbi:MAG: valine--tRNA ligase, partial [Novosphingobium sp.]|nr:valine--tRNA ligase [Novosphingobium sp.]